MRPARSAIHIPSVQLGAGAKDFGSFWQMTPFICNAAVSISVPEKSDGSLERKSPYRHFDARRIGEELHGASVHGALSRYWPVKLDAGMV